ncbi:YgaB family protein, partial [Neobacillus drentensis]|uniref:YgaB family protein n=2 Tax=Bacillaceae TaxID=186817 RepID=UPI003B589658
KAVREMDHFNRLVSDQLVTMDKLLYLQGELERCQQIEEELQTLQKATDLESVQSDIQLMKKELKEIQTIFEKQTEEVINSYREMNLSSSF